MTTRVVLVTAVAAASMSGCSGSEVVSTAPAWRATPSSVPVQLAGPLRCGTPSRALVDRGTDVLAAHPGPVTATTLVPAAVTETGQWFVIGIDRAYATDDGSLGGGESRGLAITDADPDHAVVIKLAAGARRAEQSTRWRNVSWTGDVRAQGERAVAQAVACLDSQY